MNRSRITIRVTLHKGIFLLLLCPVKLCFCCMLGFFIPRPNQIHECAKLKIYSCEVIRRSVCLQFYFSNIGNLAGYFILIIDHKLILFVLHRILITHAHLFYAFCCLLIRVDCVLIR